MPATSEIDLVGSRDSLEDFCVAAFVMDAAGIRQAGGQRAAKIPAALKRAEELFVRPNDFPGPVEGLFVLSRLSQSFSGKRFLRAAK